MAVSQEFRDVIQEKLKNFNKKMLKDLLKQLTQEKKRRKKKKK